MRRTLIAVVAALTLGLGGVAFALATVPDTASTAALAVEADVPNPDW